MSSKQTFTILPETGSVMENVEIAIGDTVDYDWNGSTDQGTVASVSVVRRRGVPTTTVGVIDSDGNRRLVFKAAVIRKVVACQQCDDGIMHRHEEAR